MIKTNNRSKKVIAALLSVFCGAAVLFAQETDNGRNFKHISMVSFGTENTFVLGQDVQSVTVKRSVKPFSINRYETTYGLWYQTRIKAEKIGYTFQNKGMPGSAGKTGEKANDYNAAFPVTYINWYDAIVWCNALSELKGLTPCYTYEGDVLRDSSDAACDLAECNWEANGYRLPSEAEWEYAARRTRIGFQAGNLVSGQVDAEGRSDSQKDYTTLCWDTFTASEAQKVGTAGIIFEEGEKVLPGSGNANGAGLFDMSGNVLEFCWDWFGDYTLTDSPAGPESGNERVSRGGSFSEYTPFVYCGDRYSFDPNESYNYTGFRFARTIK